MHEWDHTSDLMALIATANFSKPFCREDFHPMRERVVHDFMLDNPEAEYERLMKEQRR
ncbi:hypothetical protein [Aporhodopirellula aestuarii]|uniref:Uncharacterized protein n=1 Tax=Aporhodopirellula aestuarii TaxID=2950107 RepID=A0ABT0TYG7_9BACT|nr:hypothetical protein [Aporhodopirellula aestuarii]MCM2369642.1 hypothetical protein [Aporhodopirellula aestuarii]